MLPELNQNNQKFLRGGQKREAGKLGSWEVEKIGRVGGENGRRGEGWKRGRVEGEKVRSSKMRLKASKPCLSVNSYELYNNRHFEAFAADSIHLKKPSVGPKGLIGPPCHGAPGRRRYEKCQYLR
jgi:hypothetical protein